MHAYECPLCNSIMPVTNATRSAFFISFDSAAKYTHIKQSFNCSEPFIAVSLFKCPKCKKLSIYAMGKNAYLDNLTTNIYPQIHHKRYPNYIPDPIREYYEQAFTVLASSHKAAYAMLRMCLQEMIHDFWQIQGDSLAQEVSMLERHISANQWKSVERVKKCGNIEAQLKEDARVILDNNPSEAKHLLKLVELFIECWYVERHKSEAFFDNGKTKAYYQNEDLVNVL